MNSSISIQRRGSELCSEENAAAGFQSLLLYLGFFSSLMMHLETLNKHIFI